MISSAANAGSSEEVDALMTEAMVQQFKAVAGMIELGILDLRFHRSMQAMLAALDQDQD